MYEISDRIQAINSCVSNVLAGPGLFLLDAILDFPKRLRIFVIEITI